MTKLIVALVLLTHQQADCDRLKNPTHKIQCQVHVDKLPRART